MQTGYMVSHEGNQIGPLEFKEIEARLNDKRLFPTDFVYAGEETPRWLGIIEFIMVYGPKKKIVETQLLTEGAKHSADAEIDWKRFVASMPVGKEDNSNLDAVKDAYPQVPDIKAGPSVYPKDEPPQVPALTEAPPPLAPPKIVARTPTPSARPPIPTMRRQGVRPIDTSAVAAVNVLPSRASKLQIKIEGEPRIGELMNVTVTALFDSGSIDKTFDGIVHLGCNRPVKGLAPLEFIDGVAQLQVRCLGMGQHQFYLSMQPMHTPVRQTPNTEVAREVSH